MDVDEKSLPEAIKSLRTKRLSLSQRSFAEKAGLLSHSAVGRYERGQETPSRSVLLNLWNLARGYPEADAIRDALGPDFEPTDPPAESVDDLANLTEREAAFLRSMLKTLRRDRAAAETLMGVANLSNRLWQRRNAIKMPRSRSEYEAESRQVLESLGVEETAESRQALSAIEEFARKSFGINKKLDGEAVSSFLEALPGLTEEIGPLIPTADQRPQLDEVLPHATEDRPYSHSDAEAEYELMRRDFPQLASSMGEPNPTKQRFAKLLTSVDLPEYRKGEGGVTLVAAHILNLFSQIPPRLRGTLVEGLSSKLHLSRHHNRSELAEKLIANWAAIGAQMGLREPDRQIFDLQHTAENIKFEQLPRSVQRELEAAYQGATSGPEFEDWFRAQMRQAARYVPPAPAPAPITEAPDDEPEIEPAPTTGKGGSKKRA